MADRDYSDKSPVQLLEEAFNLIGASMMNKIHAAQLLAYVYVMGGGNEAVVYNPALNNAIKIAQEKFHIYGGEVPTEDGRILLQTCIIELEREMENCIWLPELLAKYGLKSMGASTVPINKKIKLDKEE